MDPTTPELPPTGLVLAAGAGRRLGQPKAPIRIADERLVDRSVRLLAEGGCDPIVVVLGAWQGSVPHAQVLINHDWQSGMASSLRVGLQHLMSLKTQVAIVAVVDQLNMTSEMVKQAANSAAPLAVTIFGQKPAHPVRLERDHWNPVLETVHADVGAREYLQLHWSEVEQLRPNPASVVADIDTPAELALARSQLD